MTDDNDTALILANKAVSLAKNGKLAEAIETNARALALVPNTYPTWYANMGSFYRQSDQPEAALSYLLHAVKLAPQVDDMRHRLGHLLGELRMFPEAKKTLLDGIRLNPTNPKLHHSLAELLLLTSDYVAGWREYEWRAQLDGQRDAITLPNSYVWNGMQLPGKLMVFCDQGMGDILQFMRFLPEVRSRCKKLVLIAHKVLHPILRQIVPDAELSDGSVTVTDFMAFCRLCSVPHILALRGPTTILSMRNSYLDINGATIETWSDRIEEILQPYGAEKQFRVGVCWQGNLKNPMVWRALPTALVPQLVAPIPNVVFMSLQLPLPEEAKDFSIVKFTEHLTDFEQTAALISNLDLVVTVDTSIAHLAGALGKTVLLMASYYYDWRWGPGVRISDWYPNTLISRQPNPGDWLTVIEEIRHMIKSTVEEVT